MSYQEVLKTGSGTISGRVSNHYHERQFVNSGIKGFFLLANEKNDINQSELFECVDSDGNDSIPKTEHVDGKKWITLGNRVSSFISLKGLCLKRNKESSWGRVYTIINPITKKYSLAPISNYKLQPRTNKA